jgi:hypothetical protein
MGTQRLIRHRDNVQHSHTLQMVLHFTCLTGASRSAKAWHKRILKVLTHSVSFFLPSIIPVCSCVRPVRPICLTTLTDCSKMHNQG